MPGRERAQHEREAGRALRAATCAGGDKAAEQGAGAPDAEQRTGGGEISAAFGGGGDRHFHRPEEGADRNEREHERPDRRSVQGAAARTLPRGLRAPCARDRLRRERRAAEEDDEGGDQERPGRRPHDAEAERERRPGDPGELDGGGVKCVGGADVVRVVEQRGEERAHAGADRRRGQPAQQGQHDEQRQRRPDRKQRHRAEHETRRNRAPGKHARLPAAIDDGPEQRSADAERHGIGAGHHAGCGERARQVLGVHEQSDAEHGQRQPGHDRDEEEAAGAGSRGERVHGGDATVGLVHAEDPVSRLWTRPVSR